MAASAVALAASGSPRRELRFDERRRPEARKNVPFIAMEPGTGLGDGWDGDRAEPRADVARASLSREVVADAGPCPD